MARPNWLKNAVFYEIYPQSFRDTNGDGIGDLAGITEKLDYIAELGANALWINPCFESPFHDAGYDISDYMKIAPRYGNNEDMHRLLDSAHDKGIRVLLDLVPGHTSVEHEWFRRSMRCEPEFSDRYIWADGPWERFEGISGVLGYINGFCERGSCATNFYSTQPAINYGFANPDKDWQTATDSPAAVASRDALKDVMKFWLDMGCDGFRIDMAHSMVKGDPDQSATIKFWKYFREFLDNEYPNAAIVSEWGDPERSLAAGFHMDFLLNFGPTKYNDLFRNNPYFSKKGGGDFSEFAKQYSELLAKAVGGVGASGDTKQTDGVSKCIGAGDGADEHSRGLICIPSSNHDMPRISRFLDDDDLKIAFAFLLSVPGAPFIYYGDEIGMRYLEEIPTVEGGYERTGSRSPMQWNRSLNSGFSSGRPGDLYIPLDPDPARPTVADQKIDPASLWNTVQALIALRKKYEPLQAEAPIEFIDIKPGGCPLVYRRGTGASAITVVLNPSSKTAEASLPAGSAGSAGSAAPTTVELLHFIGTRSEISNGKIKIGPSSAAFLR